MLRLGRVIRVDDAIKFFGDDRTDGRKQQGMSIFIFPIIDSYGTPYCEKPSQKCTSQIRRRLNAEWKTAQLYLKSRGPILGDNPELFRVLRRSSC